jgi:alpha-ketoglutarate-dependent taurine dioxygenase
MTITVTPLHPHIGAEVSGLDVAAPLGNSTLDTLWRRSTGIACWC